MAWVCMTVTQTLRQHSRLTECALRLQSRAAAVNRQARHWCGLEGQGAATWQAPRGSCSRSWAAAVGSRCYSAAAGRAKGQLPGRCCWGAAAGAERQLSAGICWSAGAERAKEQLPGSCCCDAAVEAERRQARAALLRPGEPRASPRSGAARMVQRKLSSRCWWHVLHRCGWKRQGAAT